MKTLLAEYSSSTLALVKWNLFFEILRLDDKETMAVFVHMIKKCKYTKFREVNFKILAQILLTPQILAHIKHDPMWSNCQWCSGTANLEHILFCCVCTNSVRSALVHDNRKLFPGCGLSTWLYGSKNSHLNPIIWVFNFSVYKAHLHACHGYHEDLALLVQNELCVYASIFPELKNLNLTFAGWRTIDWTQYPLQLSTTALFASKTCCIMV